MNFGMPTMEGVVVGTDMATMFKLTKWLVEISLCGYSYRRALRNRRIKKPQVRFWGNK